MRNSFQRSLGWAEVAVCAMALTSLLFLSQGCTSSKSPSGSGGGASFTPKDVQINVGDTVKWVGVSGTHTVTSGNGANDFSSGQLFDQELAVGQTFSRVFETPGVVPYFCRPHEAMGMKGTVTVAAIASQTVQVSASGVSFSPANVSINVGDAVRWTSSGSHTVTSGTGAADPNAGNEFDRTLPAGQSFQHTFSAPGVYHYFCRPHEGSGMKGTVTVTALKAKTVIVDATS